MTVNKENEIIDKWEDLLKHRENFPEVLPRQGKGWIFRGEHKKFPELTSSLEREPLNVLAD